MRLIIHGNETARECAALSSFFASLGEAREQDAKDLNTAARGVSDLLSKFARRNIEESTAEPSPQSGALVNQVVISAPADQQVSAEAVVEAGKPRRTRTVKEKPAPVIGEGAPTPPPVVATELPETAAQQPVVQQAAAEVPPGAAFMVSPAVEAPSPPPAPLVAQPTTASEGAPTKQDALAALEKLLAAKNMDACAAALAHFSDDAGQPCKAVRQINPAQYGAFIQRCEEMAK